MQYKKPLIRLLRPHFAWLLLAVLLSILSVAAQLSWPVLIGDAIDCIAPGATDFEALWRFLSLGIALIAGVIRLAVLFAAAQLAQVGRKQADASAAAAE